MILFVLLGCLASTYALVVPSRLHTSPRAGRASLKMGVDQGVITTVSFSSAPIDFASIGADIAISPAEDIKRIVMKFGGSSLASPERVTYVAKLIQQHYLAGYKPTIVCSAMGKTTNTLLSAGDFALKGQVYVDSLRTMHISTAEALGLGASTIDSINGLLSELEKLLEGVKYIGELTPRTRDLLVSYGERMSVRIVAGLLNKFGIPSQYFDSWNLGLVTTSAFGNAEIKEESYANIQGTLGKMDGQIVAVVTGFIGHDSQGRVTTLGRGGSDLSATVLGAAVGVDEIQVWKDVDGIMTTDPRLVKAALPVDTITYEEAAELAFFGAEVLHPIAMQPAIRSGIPVRVKNSYNPQAAGTVIIARRDKSDTLVTAITAKNNVQVVDIVSTGMLGQFGFLAKVFAIFEDCGISVDMIASSDVSLSLTLDKKQIDDGNVPLLVNKLKVFSEVTELDSRCIISLISNLERSSEVMGIAFKVLEHIGVRVEMLSQGASKVNISLVVKMSEKEKVIKALHACFFEGKRPEEMSP